MKRKTRKQPRILTKRKYVRKMLPNERMTDPDVLATPALGKAEMEKLYPPVPNPYWATGAKIEEGADTVQIGGEHYKVANNGQQHWNLVVAYGWDYFTSQCTKYLFRWPYKGNVEDLKKARHYLDKLIELVEDGWLPDWRPSKAWDKPERRQD